jgi:hypothetical protein
MMLTGGKGPEFAPGTGVITWEVVKSK